MAEADKSPLAPAGASQLLAVLLSHLLPLLRRVGAWVLTLAIIVLAFLLVLHMIGLVLGLVVLACLGLGLFTLWWPEESRLVRQWLRATLQS